MFALRNFSLLKQSVLQQGIKPTTGQCFRSLCTTTHEVQRDNDMPVQMENPYKIPQKGCILCNTPIDYRNIQLLSQFISPHTGRIYGRHITGLCSRKQKQISKAIKRAQAMGYMSVTLKHPQLMKDPNICDIRHLE